MGWSNRGIVSLESVAEGNFEEEETSMPDKIQKIVKGVKYYLSGQSKDFSDVPLDLSGRSPFAIEVYRTTQKIPRGQTVAYGNLAQKMGCPKAARAVGQALAHNPVPLFVPCHRVISASGGWGGFSMKGGLKIKAVLLALEGVEIPLVGR
ncbi:MAG: methylated-DNA--[protein]-cysteine S-methyltransferase [Puniceicoccales bacterium]|nr:methylated-DNA--[protein]-cysteine S-methyltransferase [Puniceicoccales bacterium]